MKKVCLAIGHWNIEQITSEALRSWRSSSALKSSTGASGERDYHWNKVMPILRDKLIASGVQVHITDAIYHDDIYSQEYDLLLFMHYDGGGTENRCMCSAPKPSQVPPYLNPEAQKKSEEFCTIWRNVYPEMTGTVNRDNRITQAMLDYYGFDYAPMDTPSVILEHFNHTSKVGEQLKNDPEKVAQADLTAILKFLNIEGVVENKDCKNEIEKALSEQEKLFATQISKLNDDVTALQLKISTDKKECENTINALEQKYEKEMTQKDEKIANLNVNIKSLLSNASLTQQERTELLLNRSLLKKAATELYKRGRFAWSTVRVLKNIIPNP